MACTRRARVAAAVTRHGTACGGREAGSEAAVAKFTGRAGFSSSTSAPCSGTRLCAEHGAAVVEDQVGLPRADGRLVGRRRGLHGPREPRREAEELVSALRQLRDRSSRASVWWSNLQRGEAELASTLASQPLPLVSSVDREPHARAHRHEPTKQSDSAHPTNSNPPKPHKQDVEHSAQDR